MTQPVRLNPDPSAMSGSRLLSVAAAQPRRVVSAAELGRPFGRTAEWIHTRTGIEAVRRVDRHENIAQLAVAAAGDALRRAGLSPGDVDLVLTASCSIDSGASAAIAARAAPGAGWMAINSACSGFCYALGAADSLIRSGAARIVLVVAAEQMSELLDPADLGTSIIFGDGAGAAVVGPAAAGETRVGPLVCGSDGARSELIACDDTGRLRMAGREVFRWAVEEMPAVAAEACARARVKLADLAAFVPHQANKRIIDALATRLGLRGTVISSDITASGNTSAASIPIALTRLLDRRPELTGRHALLLGFGAGLSYAGQVVQLP